MNTKIKYPIFYPSHPLHLSEQSRLAPILAKLMPGTKEIKAATGIPPKAIERHGGIEAFYALFGISYSDRRRGPLRAAIANEANRLSEADDSNFYLTLVKKFGEVAVHRQSPYPGGLYRSDYKVFPKNKAPFHVDIFRPMDMHTFTGCVNIKLRKLSAIDFIATPVWFVSMNEDYITPNTIQDFIAKRRIPLPENIHIFTLTQAINLL
jgi:hypothetical protein